jgi:hypothetical protein
MYDYGRLLLQFHKCGQQFLCLWVANSPFSKQEFVEDAMHIPSHILLFLFLQVNTSVSID